jgi:outer membrane protein OmpA-like peptidoglycan-associated protein
MLRTRFSALLLAVAAPAAMAQTATSSPNPIDVSGGGRDNGTRSASLLAIGIAPRPIGLAGAMGAVEGDPSSIWYNAAGLARVRTNAFLITASQRFADTRLGGASILFPTQIGTFSIAARALDEGSIDQSENFNLLGRCRSYQLGLQGGGALQLQDHLEIGGSFFYSQETLCSQSAATIGVNFGVLSPDWWDQLAVGAGFSNWGTSVTFDSAGFSPPLDFYLAAAWDFLKHRNLISTPMLFRGQPIVGDGKLVAQVDFPAGSSAFAGFGVEGTLNGVAIGRIGYLVGNDNRAGLTLGAGINVGQFRLEYGFRNRKNIGTSLFSYDPIGDDHHVSATLFFGGPQTNQPVVPVIINQPIDTAAINAAVRDAMAREMANLRPLLDSLKNARVEVRSDSNMVSRYFVPVHFAFDSAIVREEDIPILSQLGELIRRAYPNALVTIEGFTDPAGSHEYNMRLSQRRAEAVKRVMVDRLNLPERQFRALGRGEELDRQVTPGAKRDQPGAEENRRVVFTIDATKHF